MIYLDNAATTFPKPECVYEACDTFARTAAVNAGRGAYKAARGATAMIRDVKARIVSLVDARDQAEVALTPSVTIALNQVIGGLPWREGSVAYVSPYEHNAVLRPLELLRERAGIRVEELPLAADLSIDLDACERAFAQLPPDLVCVSAISNVTGYALPARDVFVRAKDAHPSCFTLLDAAQAMGLLRLRFGALRADAVTFAGHKTLYAPFGVAGALLKNGVQLSEVLAGGNGIRSEDPHMPRTLPEKLECGSADTVAIAGLAASLEWLNGRDLWGHEHDLMAYLMPRLTEVPGVTIYRAPLAGEDGLGSQAGVVSFNLDGFRANEVGALLDAQADIAVRAGHHCAGRIHRHLNDREHDGTVRVSVGAFTTRADIDALLQALQSIDREALKGIDANVLRGNC